MKNETIKEEKINFRIVKKKSLVKKRKETVSKVVVRVNH